MRMMLLSAVLSGVRQVGKMAGRGCGRHRFRLMEAHRETRRRVVGCKQEGSLNWYLGDDPLRSPGTRRDSLLGPRTLPWPDPKIYPTGKYGQIRKQRPVAFANVAFLVDYLLEEFGGPLLCVCATKENTRAVASALTGRLPPMELPGRHVSKAIHRIEAGHRYLMSLALHLRHGVAFHNSAVPTDIGVLIEDAVKERELRVVASTTTLAEGVDRPFRFTVLVDWLMWTSAGLTPVSTLLFKNIAGRCGRAGEFTEGDTIVFDNPLGDVRFTQAPNRWIVQRDVLLAEKAPEHQATSSAASAAMGSITFHATDART